LRVAFSPAGSFRPAISLFGRFAHPFAASFPDSENAVIKPNVRAGLDGITFECDMSRSETLNSVNDPSKADP
jgi:hypothetical protein